MIPKILSVSTILCTLVTAQVARNHDIPLKNWPAPLYWQAPEKPESRTLAPHAATLTTSPLVFIAMSPCRVVDTRASQHFPDPFGAPSLAPAAPRTFTIQTSTLCSIPSTAQAYSFNVTLVPPGVVGFLTIYPHGQLQPNAVTLDDLLGTIVNNAAIVPAGSPNGAVDAVTNGNTDLVIDINGYYVPLNKSDLGNSNTALGVNAFGSNTTGDNNTAIGSNALAANTTGRFNSGIGDAALQFNTAGNGNTAIGFSASGNNNPGDRNIAIGDYSGDNITGSNNIDIGNPGASTDNGIIRIGDPARHKAFVAAGVWQTQTNPGPVPVMIDQYGLMGTVSSSRRYKEDIQDLGDASSGLLSLRPVKFRYRKPYSDGSKPLDYGLIAEEVAEIYPDLVVKGKDGQIETVQYQKLTPMLLNEVQKDHSTIQELQAEVAALQKALQTLLSGRAVLPISQ